jgi:hypothetical protein
VFVRSFSATAYLLVACAAVDALGQQVATIQRSYDGIQAGIDAYHLAEEKRQADVSQQLFLNDQMRFFSGYPTSRAETIYYGYTTPYYGYATPFATRANLDYIYAYGAAVPWGVPLAVFRPWPLVPGHIYGYPAYYQPARQPIGRQEIQTGPRRWESHPLYAPPAVNGTFYAAPIESAPQVESIPPEPPPQANSPAGEPAPIGPPALRRGPREY